MHRTTPQGQRPAGTAMIIALVFALLIAGIAIPTLTQAVKTQQAASSGIIATRLLLVAESGLGYAYSELEKDALYAAKDQAAFTWNPGTRSYEWISAQRIAIAGEPLDSAETNPAQVGQTFHLAIQYINNGSGPVEFASRYSPSERFDKIKVTARASGGGTTREVVAWYAFRFGFRGAIVSDNVPDDSASDFRGSPKSYAKQGHIVFDGKGTTGEHVVFGDLHSNGEVVYFEDKEKVPLTATNANDFFLSYNGVIHANLGGSIKQIPDFTDTSSQRQLFDFDRFEAAAARGAGAIYNGLDEFRAALEMSRDTDQPLEGIIYVKVDPGVEGNSPKIKGLPINVTGTLVFDFADGTDIGYKVVLDKDVPVHINAADLTDVDFTDPFSYSSGYPGTYVDESKQPFNVDITDEGFDNFTRFDDLPAVMFNNGIVDLHGELNICGVVYGPAFIEIENKGGNVMYINGALFGGGGVYMQAGKKGEGVIAIKHDANTTDDLALVNNIATSFERIGYSITR